MVVFHGWPFAHVALPNLTMAVNGDGSEKTVAGHLLPG
jgi:hypothetical protein